MRRAGLLLLVVLLIGGCGGSSGTPQPDSPTHVVEAFIAEVKNGHWKAACDLVSPVGRTLLGLRIGVNFDTELTPFGELKDCPRSLAAHVPRARTLVKGADPGSSRPFHGGAAVSSPRGDWIVAHAEPPAKGWRVDGFPPPQQ